jgi:hypothetical protein
MKLTVYWRNWLRRPGEYRPAGMKLSILDFCLACFYYPPPHYLVFASAPVRLCSLLADRADAIFQLTLA